jgi:hypothetical protein
MHGVERGVVLDRPGRAHRAATWNRSSTAAVYQVIEPPPEIPVTATRFESTSGRVSR